LIGYAHQTDGHIGPLAVVQDDALGGKHLQRRNLAAEGGVRMSAFCLARDTI
jgi:hypothetical protein